MNFNKFSVSSIHQLLVSVRQYSKGKSHYDALGLTPKATQNDIKKAYYKLSMRYHPDKNQGSDAATTKFRDITAAYEVLGNYKLRRLYDRGMLNADDEPVLHQPTPAQPYQSRGFERDKIGRTTIYDFDEWSKAHYGSSFERRNAAKKTFHSINLRNQINREAAAKENVIVMMGVALCVWFLFAFISGSSEDDRLVKQLEERRQSKDK